MKWTQQRASLHGEIGGSDRLADISHMACPTCDSAFDSVTLSFHELAIVNSDDLEALAGYCQNLSARGGRMSIHTSRPALRRLFLASPLIGFVATEVDDEPGPGEPYTCPHR